MFLLCFFEIDFKLIWYFLFFLIVSQQYLSHEKHFNLSEFIFWHFLMYCQKQFYLGNKCRIKKRFGYGLDTKHHKASDWGASFLRIIHEVTVTFGVGADDGGDLMFKTLFCHNGILFFKVLNYRTQYLIIRRTADLDGK